MFANEYQGGGHVEILGTQGQNPLSQWKVTGAQKGVQKLFDKAVKGYVIATSAGCKLQLPRDDRSSLGLVQPHLVLQLELSSGSPFSVELGLSDLGATRRRMILSSSFSELKCTPLHCQVPIASAVVRDMWLNLALPLAELTSAFFKGAVFRTLDTITLSGTAKIRKAITLRDSLSTDPAALPKLLELPLGVEYVTHILDPRSVSASVSATAGPGLGGLGGMGVVGTATGTSRRPSALIINPTATMMNGLTIMGSGSSGGGAVHGHALSAGGAAPHHAGVHYHPHAHHATAPANGNSTGQHSAESDHEGERGPGSGPLGAMFSGVAASLHNGVGSAPSTPTGGRSSGASPWSSGRPADHPPPSRLNRAAAGSGMPLSPASAAAAVAAGQMRGSRLQAPAQAAEAAPHSSLSGMPPSTEEQLAQCLIMGGRRAISAQNAVRASSLASAPSSVEPVPVSSGSGVSGAGGDAAAAAKPRSPPWPKSVISKRAQSGPARISTDAQGLGETMAPGDVPMSPSLVPRHGRRSIAARNNYIPTISEHEVFGVPGGVQSSGGSLQPTSSIGLVPLPPAAPRSPNRSPSRMRASGAMPPGALSAAAAAMSAASAHSLANLGSVLQVRAGLDASVDASVQALGDSPCSPSFISAIRINSSQAAHRYGPTSSSVSASKAAAGNPFDGMGSSGSDGDSPGAESVPVTVPRINTRTGAAAAKRAVAGGPAASRTGLPPPHPDTVGYGSDAGGTPKAAAAATAAGTRAAELAAAARGGGRGSPALTPTKAAVAAAAPGRFGAASPSRQRRAESEEVATPSRANPSSVRSAASASAATPPSGQRRAADADEAGTPSRPTPSSVRAAAGSAASASAATPSGAASRRPVRQGKADVPALPPGRSGSPGPHGHAPTARAAAAAARERLPPLAPMGAAPAARRPARAPRTTTDAAESIADVEESIAINTWDGFGVDEDDDVLNSRHFRPVGGAGAAHAGGGGDNSSGSDMEPNILAAPARGGGTPDTAVGRRRGAAGMHLPSIGSAAPVAPLAHHHALAPPAVAVPPPAMGGATIIPLAPGAIGIEHGHGHGAHAHVNGLDVPSPQGAAAPPSSPPIRRSTPLHDTYMHSPTSHSNAANGSGSGGGYMATTAAERASIGALINSPSTRPAAPTDPALNALLDEDALLAGRPTNMDDYDDWANVDKGPTPHDLQQRLYTPPLVPASKALGLASHHGASSGGAGGGGTQVLKVGGGAGSATAVAEEPVDKMLDLIYDPVLNCYYDSKTGQYYELTK